MLQPYIESVVALSDNWKLKAVDTFQYQNCG